MVQQNEAVGGTFVNVKDQAYVDFLVNLGKSINDYFHVFRVLLLRQLVNLSITIEAKSIYTHTPVSWLFLLHSSGVSKEKATPVLGTHWTHKFFQSTPGVWISHSICQEIPSLNALDSFSHGQEKYINNPFLGGKTRIQCECHEDGFTFTARETPFGDLSFRDVFTSKGNTTTITVKNTGATFIEKWTR